MALSVADMIDAVEVAEIAAPDDPELHDYGRKVEASLAHLQRSLDDIDDVDTVVRTLWQ